MKDDNKKHEVHSFNAALDTPMRSDAFDLSDDEKIVKIQEHFKVIMETLGLDLTDDSLKNTPNRVAKMYVKEIFSGLDPKNKPAVTLFENKYGYNQMLVEKNISVYSQCEHHFVPIIGKAHVAYIANGKVIGLSKIHRKATTSAREAHKTDSRSSKKHTWHRRRCSIYRCSSYVCGVSRCRRCYL